MRIYLHRKTCSVVFIYLVALALFQLLFTALETSAAVLPDLVVTDVDATPEVAEIGQIVVFRVTVANQGEEASSITYVELDLSRFRGQGTVLWVGVANLPSLNPGQQMILTISGGQGYSADWAPEANGIYIATATVDPESVVPDDDRENNRAGTSVQVGVPDFEIVSVNIMSALSPPRIGEPVTIEATIRNNNPDGPYPSYIECDINRYRAPEGEDPVFVGTHEFTIDGDETITVTIDDTWVPTENWIYIIALLVDPPYAYPKYENDHGDIIETNDTYKDIEGIHFANNAQWTAVQVGFPDFEVTNVSLISDLSPYRAGQPITIEATVRNNNSDGPYPTYVECEINLFKAPEGAPPAWIGTSELIIDGNETVTVQIENITDDGYPDGPWVPANQDLYIIAVIVDPPYAYPDYEHDHGDIIETNDTYDDEGIQFGNNAQWTSCCVYEHGTVPPDPGDAHTWLSASLVRDQEGGPGYLLRSYGIDSCMWNAYAYDQALGIISFTILEDYGNARKILDELEYLQEEDGSFIFVWHAPRPRSVDLLGFRKRMVGTNAWIVMAISFYTAQTQDESYLEMAGACADWIMDLQDGDGGIFGGFGDPLIYPPDGKLTWKSVEHNLDSYSGLHFLSHLASGASEQEGYANAAEKVEQWLHTMWLDDDGRFARGANDDYMVTDTNTWGILALGRTGPNGEDYTRGLDWCFGNTYLCEDYERCSGEVATVCGFDVNYDCDTVWTEGTLGFALASYKVEDHEDYNGFLSEMTETQCTNGGIPYSNSIGSAGDGDTTSTFLSVAGTAWYIMAQQKFNPFNVPPVADDQTVITDEDTSVDITLAGSDANGDLIIYSVVGEPSNGSLTGTAPDLTYTPNPGFEGSDSFTFMMNDGAFDSNIATVSIIVSSHYFLCDLEQNWNLVSFPVQPLITNIDNVLSSTHGKVRAVWTYNSNLGWRWFLRDVPQLSNLWEMESGSGYWVEAEGACDLVIEGTLPATAIQLYEDWNLVGFSSKISKDIEDAMSSVAGKYNSVWAYDPVWGWSYYLPDTPEMSNLEFMHSGKGYIIDAKQACIWDIMR